MTVYLNALGIACALGDTPQAVRAAVRADTPPDSGELTDRFTPGRVLQVGTVPSLRALPDDTPHTLRSRNNAMLAHVVAQIRPTIDAMLQRVSPARIAVVMGTSTSGIREGGDAIRARRAAHAWPEGFHYAQQELGSPAQFVARQLGVTGPAYTVSTACSSSAKALAAGARLLASGLADAVIAGGADTLCPFTIGGFTSLGAVAAARCNPFSRHRQGINLGEGAAVFAMSRESGPVRLAGWGETSDAYHMSAPDPSGAGALAAMQAALGRAGLAPGDIDYLNLHGTATVQNDAMEALATDALFGPSLACSSTKSMTGHALGAAGAIEAGLLWLSLVDNPRGQLPMHWWDGEADPALPPLRLLSAGDTLGRAPRYAMSNSFAFGGSNSALILGAA
jgi:3-oxoacyl-[acyl-carrier-protein] synthase-1